MTEIVEKEIVSVLNGTDKIRLFIYGSAQECMEAWCRCPLSEIKEWGGFDGDGKEYSIPPEKVLSGIKESGCWGFCGNKNSIHIWFDSKCDMSDLVHLLAHERGHILKPHKRSDDREEIKAEKYGDTARFAFDVANSLLNQK